MAKKPKKRAAKKSAPARKNYPQLAQAVGHINANGAGGRGFMELVRQYKAGAELADAAGVSRQAVNKWDKVPAELVPDIERATGISRKVMRPDHFA